MARRTFGATWWGQAWLDALEQRALVDPNRLPRGRTYARQDRVRDIELSPGRLGAKVWGTERYTTQLSVRVLTDAEWNTVLDTIMAQAANAAALLSGEVPQAIGDLVLPGQGDLGPACSCPDWAEPCKHAAALCYVAADLFDEDPFALLTLRGRGRDEVLAEVRRRRAEALGAGQVIASDEPRGADPGVSAAAAYKRTRGEVVPSRPVPRQPAGASHYHLGVAGPVDAGIDDTALRSLVADAADRAWRMLAVGAPSGLAGSVGDDVVRRAARSTPREIEEVAEATGLDHDELRAAAIAWRVGERAGLLVARRRWQPEAGLLEPAVAALGGQAGEAKVRANRVSVPGLQLRLDEEGRWWRFAADDELGWILAFGPADDPADLLT